MSRLDVVAFSSDPGPPEAERRTKCVLLSGQQRLVLLVVSGGMMDLGWAQRATPHFAAPVGRFVARGEAAFSAAVATLVQQTRETLTAIEHDERLYCSVQLLALERAGRHYQLARIGGMQVLALCPASFVSRVGSEDVISLAPGEPPRVLTAALIPDLRWRTGEGRSGWVLQDEASEATRGAGRLRHELFEANESTSLLLMTHPFWTEVDISRLPRTLDDAGVVRALRDQVAEAYPHRTDAIAVLCRP